MGWLIVGVAACGLAAVVAVVNARLTPFGQHWLLTRSPATWVLAVPPAWAAWSLFLWRAASLHHTSLGPRDAEVVGTFFPLVVAAVPLALMTAAPACAALTVYLPALIPPPHEEDRRAHAPDGLQTRLQPWACFAGAAFAALVFCDVTLSTARVEGDRLRVGGRLSPAFPFGVTLWCQDAKSLCVTPGNWNDDNFAPACRADFDGASVRLTGEAGRGVLAALSRRSGVPVRETPPAAGNGPAAEAPTVTVWSALALALVAGAGAATTARTLRLCRTPVLDWKGEHPIVWLAAVGAMSVFWWGSLLALILLHHASLPRGDYLVVGRLLHLLLFIGPLLGGLTANPALAAGTAFWRAALRAAGQAHRGPEPGLADDKDLDTEWLLKPAVLAGCLAWVCVETTSYVRIDPAGVVLSRWEGGFRTRRYSFEELISVRKEWRKHSKGERYQIWVARFRDGFDWEGVPAGRPVELLVAGSGVPLEIRKPQ